MTINAESIPSELRERPQWVIWKFEQRAGRPTKVPYCAASPAARASVSDPATWGTFVEALAQVQLGIGDGLGYVFAADDPFAGVDLDRCLQQGRLHHAAAALVSRLDSYTEVSPSGSGVHVIVRAGLNGHPRKRTRAAGFGGEFESYDVGRFFCFTGRHVRGTPTTIEARQDELEQVLAMIFPPEPERPPVKRPAEPLDIDDEELLERARRARDGVKFSALYDGDTSGYDGDHSRADAALVAKLVFWTAGDGGRVDRLFRRSALMRDKWDERRGDTTYGELTVARALGRATDFYTPRAKRATPANTPVEEAARRTRASESVESVDSARGDLGRNRLTDSALKESVRSESVPPRADDEGFRTDSESEAESVATFALPVRDFIGRPREHREPILADVDGRPVIGHRSLTLLGGLGGSGKTTFFIDLALHLAAGVDFPPFTVPAPVSVLLIENEGPEDLFAEKLAARLATFPHELRARLDVCVFDWGGFNLAEDVHRERLANEIAERGYDLVFGDPLDSLGIEGVGSPQDTRDFLALMKLAGLNRTCAWWLNTHPRKEETKEALNEISGAWGGKPDSVLLMRMLADDRTQVRFPKLRWAKRGRRPAILYGFDPETEAFAYLGEESEGERNYLAELRELLADGTWRIVKEIAAPKAGGGIGANADVVKRVLEEHPDVFESRTGDGASQLGRSSLATVWGLLSPEPAEALSP